MTIGINATMTAEDIMDEAACHAGWNTASQLSVALAYIENQQTNEEFLEYVEERTDGEDVYNDDDDDD